MRYSALSNKFSEKVKTRKHKQNSWWRDGTRLWVSDIPTTSHYWWSGHQRAISWNVQTPAVSQVYQRISRHSQDDVTKAVHSSIMQSRFHTFSLLVLFFSTPLFYFLQNLQAEIWNVAASFRHYYNSYNQYQYQYYYSLLLMEHWQLW